MNAVLIVPTGIGCEIGGHAGDANPVAKLLASVCDKLILHPNVVNASDINEMPDNCLYVEGSILDRFLEGRIALDEVQMNTVLVAVNPPLKNETINAVSAARATIGSDAFIVVLETPLILTATMTDRGATGTVGGWQQLVQQVKGYPFDALAITTPIDVSDEVALNYFRNAGINPEGGVEAKASKLIAKALNKPVAHAPTESESLKNFNEIVDCRIAPEMISQCYLHSVLKGLHKAPRPGPLPGYKGSINVRQVSAMVSPFGCWGRPHIACMERGIPIIAVKENRTCLNDNMAGAIVVNNYWEAAGVLMCMKAGVHPSSVRRPLRETTLHRGKS